VGLLQVYVIYLTQNADHKSNTAQDVA